MATPIPIRVRAHRPSLFRLLFHRISVPLALKQQPIFGSLSNTRVASSSFAVFRRLISFLPFFPASSLSRSFFSFAIRSIRARVTESRRHYQCRGNLSPSTVDGNFEEQDARWSTDEGVWMEMVSLGSFIVIVLYFSFLPFFSISF